MTDTYSHFDLEIEKLIATIKESSSKKVLLQLPDGLKPSAKKIQDEVTGKTDAEVYLWLGSCFGSCDLPIEVKSLGVDLLVQWGHPAWKYD